MISRRWPGARQRTDGPDIDSTNLAELGCGVIPLLARPPLQVVAATDVVTDRSAIVYRFEFLSGQAAPVQPGEPFPAA